MPESKCVKHKAHRLSPFCQAISCGCQNSLAAAASPSSPPSPSCLSSRQQRGGQNSSSRSCTTPCSCEKASLCPPCLNIQQRRTELCQIMCFSMQTWRGLSQQLSVERTPTDSALLCAATAPTFLRLPWSRHSANSGRLL